MPGLRAPSKGAIQIAHYVCVTGGREFDDRDAVYRVLHFLKQMDGDELRLIHGGARGADTLADEVAVELGITKRIYNADWTGECQDRCRPDHRRPREGGGTICPAAGNYRNEKMADILDRWRHQGHSVQVLAFPGGNGTAHMVAYCEQIGVPVSYQYER